MFGPVPSAPTAWRWLADAGETLLTPLRAARASASRFHEVSCPPQEKGLAFDDRIGVLADGMAFRHEDVQTPGLLTDTAPLE